MNTFRQMKPLDSIVYLYRAISKYEPSFKKETLLNLASDIPKLNLQKLEETIDSISKSEISEPEFLNIIRTFQFKTANIYSIYERFLKKYVSLSSSLTLLGAHHPPPPTKPLGIVKTRRQIRQGLRAVRCRENWLHRPHRPPQILPNEKNRHPAHPQERPLQRFCQDGARQVQRSVPRKIHQLLLWELQSSFRGVGQPSR